MFQFASFSFLHLFIQCKITEYELSWVVPFGDLRIKAYLRLPEAYRSLPRPSSPVSAKSSIINPL